MDLYTNDPNRRKVTIYLYGTGFLSEAIQTRTKLSGD